MTNTNKRFRVFPYKQGSKSAKLLAETLGGLVLRKTNSLFQPRSTDIIINWGSSDVPDFSPATVLNGQVETAQCKLTAFKLFRQFGVSCPQFWTNQNDVPDEAYPVFARTVLNGHSGSGIVSLASRENSVEAPLYTQYVKKKHEYRVHVIKLYEDGQPKFVDFFVQRKAKKNGVTNPNWQVRNLAGGFSFVEVDSENVPDCVLEQAYKAIEALGLDFGGVDVIYNAHDNKAYVLEVNTACGLEQRTANYYKEAFNDFANLSS